MHDDQTMVMFMPNPDESNLIQRLLAQDETVPNELLDRYNDRLVRLARHHLRSMPNQIADDEGAVISAFRSFFSGLAKDEFSTLRSDEDLWKLLATITIRKSIRQLRKHWKKSGEGGKRVHSLDVNNVLNSAPSHEEVIGLIDECEYKVQQLRDESLMRIATLTLAGHSTSEIARQMRIHQRTIQRKLEIIRNEWNRETEASDE